MKAMKAMKAPIKAPGPMRGKQIKAMKSMVSGRRALAMKKKISKPTVVMKAKAKPPPSMKPTVVKKTKAIDIADAVKIAKALKEAGIDKDAAISAVAVIQARQEGRGRGRGALSRGRGSVARGLGRMARGMKAVFAKGMKAAKEALTTAEIETNWLIMPMNASDLTEEPTP